MARPVDLACDLRAVKGRGVTTIVSLLEPEEAAALSISEERAFCKTLGLRFLSHPVRDMHLPEAAPFRVFAARIAGQIRNGAHIAIHCRASIGRSGMLACLTLGHFGYGAARALAHVTSVRGCTVPDTGEQTAFIHEQMARQQR